MVKPPSNGPIDARDQRRFDYGSWVVLGVVLIFFAWSLAGAAAQLAIPNDGCLVDMTNFEAPVVQVCIGDWRMPLRPGDRSCDPCAP